MTLVQKGRVDLDEPIIRYLSSWSFPPSNYDEQQITIRQLLSNSAGLPLGTVGEETEYSPGSEMPSITQYLDQEARLAHRPGSRFEYSNPGYNTLELVVEDITGEHFSEYMQHALLHPLNMTEASYAWRGPYAQSIPTGYELDGDPVPAYVYPVQASGGLFANVKDIGRFVSAGISALQTESSTVLDPYFVKMIYTPQIEIKGLLGLVADSYGFGHFIETLPGGQNAIWHGGQGHGWMTHFHMIPETGDGIVILTNSQRSWPLIAELLLDWSEWIGIGPVKFSRIVYATKAGWLVTGLVTGWAVLIFSQLGINLMNGKSKLEPFSKHKLATRFAKFSSGFVLFGLVILRTLQPYVFESSIFPGLIRWFAASVLVLSSAMLISSLFIDVQTCPLDN
jgi:CubicO group peptidase (beta-lactamase class C family)